MTLFVVEKISLILTRCLEDHVLCAIDPVIVLDLFRICYHFSSNLWVFQKFLTR